MNKNENFERLNSLAFTTLSFCSTRFPLTMKRYLTFSLLSAFTWFQPSLSINDCFGGADNAAYIDWAAGAGASYTAAVCYNASSPDTTQGVAVHWKLDDENIHLAFAARATGFVSFGISENGGMKGADLVIFETANPGKLRDTHVLDAFLPVDDVCQDWVFVDSHEDGGFLIVEVSRKLDTMDTQDHKIINDVDIAVPPQRIIAAWGDTDTASYHGQNNARGSVRWYGGGDELKLVQAQLEFQADNSFLLRIPNHTLATKETDYVDFCFVWDPDFTIQGVPANSSIAVIAADMEITDEARPYIHHLAVYATDIASNQSRTCIESGYGYAVYSWAPGFLPLLLPDNVAYNMGPTSPNGLQSFRIQVHYNNPKLIENVTDNSALRVYYSLTPREHELGLMALGDPVSHLLGTPIPGGLTQYDFECSSQCSSIALDEPVTVIQEMYHMHINGIAGVNYQIRDNEIIRQSNMDFFDFDQTGKFVSCCNAFSILLTIPSNIISLFVAFTGSPTIRQAPYTINPGDSFISKFWLDNATMFGRGSAEEMIEVTFLYYPAKKLVNQYPWGCIYDVPFGPCNATLTSRVLTSAAEVERVFGKVPSQCQVNKEPSTTETPTGNTTSMGHAMVTGSLFLSPIVFAVAICLPLLF
jgi:DOMON domain/Copper type II ascorbate-dependent monooxygenase, N-terminal domain